MLECTMKMKLAIYKLNKFIYMVFWPCIFIVMLVFLPWVIFYAPLDIWRVIPNVYGPPTDVMRWKVKMGGCIVGTAVLIVAGFNTMKIVKSLFRKRRLQRKY